MFDSTSKLLLIVLVAEFYNYAVGLNRIPNPSGGTRIAELFRIAYREYSNKITKQSKLIHLPEIKDNEVCVKLAGDGCIKAPSIKNVPQNGECNKTSPELKIKLTECECTDPDGNSSCLYLLDRYDGTFFVLEEVPGSTSVYPTSIYCRGNNTLYIGSAPN